MTRVVVGFWLAFLGCASAFIMNSKLRALPTDATALSASSRRDFMNQALLIGAATMVTAPPVFAKETEALTEENVNAAWAALEKEMNDPNGGVSYMQKCIDTEDFPALMQFTQTYDIGLRKNLIGRCKKFLPPGEKSIATVTGNAITFDLIGMNQNSRPGKEDKERANRYLNELRTDLQAIIDQKAMVSFDLEV